MTLTVEKKQRRSRPCLGLRLLLGLGLVGFGYAAVIAPDVSQLQMLWRKWQPGEVAPLAMAGGDPYVRALMRTISVSEANDPSPYNLLYGGEYFRDYSHHPDHCVPIVRGPNVGQCTTAAGRYQFLSSTWQEKAALYHPESPGWFWSSYSFAPEFQDQVVYSWLTDTQAWDSDIPQLLRAGEIQTVLAILSDTWTSLGYGIEDNIMTPSLERTYWKLLDQELAQSGENPQAQR